MITWDELPRAKHLATHIAPAHRQSAAALATDMTVQDIMQRFKISLNDIRRHEQYIRLAMGRSRPDRVGQDNPLHPENWRYRLAEAAFGTGPCWCEARHDHGKKK